MPETGREFSDERSTPTEQSVTSLVSAQTTGLTTAELSHRVGATGVAGPRESRGMPLENPPRLLRQIQSPGKREVSPGDCRARSA